MSRHAFTVGGEFVDKNNTGNDTFTIDLPREVDFSLGYQVALQSLSLHSGGWNQVRSGENLIILRNSNFYWIERCYVPEGYYTSPEDLKNAINVAINTRKYHADFFWENKRKDGHPMEEERLYFSKQLPVDDEEYFRKESRYRTVGFEGFIDFGGRFFIDPDKDNRMKFKSTSQLGETSILLCNQLATLIGMGPLSNRLIWIKNDDHLPNQMNLCANNLSLIWVLANFVEGTYVNDTIQPLLKLVAIDDVSNQVINKVIANHIYVPVKPTHIKQLQLTFKSHSPSSPNLVLRNTVRFMLHFVPTT